MSVVLRPATATDVDAVLALWRDADAEPSHTDDVAGLRSLLERDAGALVIAEDDGRVVGSVIAAWDGWRGSVYRLAVRSSHRRQGLGRQLVAAAEERLQHLGARRLQAIVVESDAQATAFWRRSGWTEQIERLRFVSG
jgi:ribosomal protein S18 acetylase RimI-like enzyme